MKLLTAFPLSEPEDNLPGTGETFSEEDADALLKSDPEEMDCEEQSESGDSSSLNDSFYSSNSVLLSGGGGLLRVSGAYRAIQAARRADMSARFLAKSNPSSQSLSPPGYLISELDRRTDNCFHVNSYEKKRNITASFDIGTLRCTTCSLKPGHTILEKINSKKRLDYHSPAVFILSDQSFPASLPTGGEGNCLHIIRLEDGSIPDLTNIFLDSLSPFGIPAGTVVLLHSLSHLAWVGAAAYAEDLVRARQRITGTYRSGVLVLHGLPLPASGSSDPNIVNDLSAVSDWLNLVRDPSERDISHTRVLWQARLLASGSEPSLSSVLGGQPPAPPPPSHPPASCLPPAQLAKTVAEPPAATNISSVRPPASEASLGLSGSPPAPLNCTPTAQGPASPLLRLRLPASPDSLKPAVFIKEWIPNCVLVPVDESLERDVLTTLLKELNSKFNSKLDLNFTTSRDTNTISDLEDTPLVHENFIAIGSSHLTRTVTAMRAQGETVNSLASPHWKLNDENVESSATALAEIIKTNTTATIIYQLFDSCVFFSSSSPGEQATPKRGEDGKFHVEGELVLADWHAFRKIFYVSIPLLRAGGNNKKIILSPLPRYSTAKCCPDIRHITNFGKKGYGTTMGSNLGDIHGWIEDFTREKRIKNFEVVCPATTISTGDNISKRDLSAFWGGDPVHLTPAGYDKLGEKLADMVVADPQPKKRERDTPQPDSKSQRPRLDDSHRQAGISKSDTLATRWDRARSQSLPNSGSGNQTGKMKR